MWTRCNETTPWARVFPETSSGSKCKLQARLVVMKSTPYAKFTETKKSIVVD